LVVAGDNLFSESLAGFVGCAKKTDATVAVYDVGDAEAIKNTVISRSTRTESSPILRKNQRNLEVPGRNRSLLLFTESAFPFHNLSRCRQQPRSAGSFCAMALPAHACKNVPAQGKWLDIGSKETLKEADEIFRKFAALKP
jgi:glucose-1-phosphate thymidylyltransferase